MSQKITAKNLSYDTTLPPFLARLHGRHQQQLSSDSPDPILAARRRPGARVRSASEEAEDAPLVVDERGHVVTAADDEQQEFDVDEETGDVVVRRKKGGEGAEESRKDGKDGDAAEREREKEKEAEKERGRVAAIGAGKKRKVGRVVGGGEDGDEAGEAGSRSDVRKTAKTKHANTTEKDAKPTAATAKPPPKKKAKKKKIQLSFGDDDGE